MALGSFPIKAESALHSLHAEMLEPGSWSFKATVTDAGVVDSTANVLIAYAACRDPVTRDGMLASGAASAAQWIASAQRQDGGWGLLREPSSGPSRHYSTALALRAIALWDPVDFERVIARAVSFLTAHQLDSGAWPDSSGRGSVPGTAECIRSLALVSNSIRPLELQIQRAQRWLIDVGNVSSMWCGTNTPGEFEEVAVLNADAPRRIEYTYSARAAALTALLYTGAAREPIVVRASAALISDAIDCNWEPYGRGRFENDPPSWMLHDVSTAVAAIRLHLLNADEEVWAGIIRVINHPPDRRWWSRRLIEYYPTLLVITGFTTLLVVVSTALEDAAKLIASVIGAAVLTLASDAFAAGVRQLISRVRLRRK